MKGVIIEVDIYSAIRLRYTGGESIRSISKSLGISRQTVKKYCEGNTHPDVRKTYERSAAVITSDVESFILSCFLEDEVENIKKQKHTAKRIYDRLVNEKNFTGSYSSVRDAVRRLRAEHEIPPPVSYTHLDVYKRQEYNKGDLLIIAAIIAWTVYSMISKKLTSVPPITSTGVSGLIATVLLFPFARCV